MSKTITVLDNDLDILAERVTDAVMRAIAPAGIKESWIYGFVKKAIEKWFEEFE